MFRQRLIISILVLAFLVLSGCTGNGTIGNSQGGAAQPFDPGSTLTVSSPRQPTPRPTHTSDGGADADVKFVRAVQASDGTWTFYVTVEHPDTGWEDYADGWDVVTPDGEVIKPEPDSPFTRLLLHPHVDEQPFTRSQGGIAIPGEVDQVTIRAHDIVDGFGGREVLVDLKADSGEAFEVERSR